MSKPKKTAAVRVNFAASQLTDQERIEAVGAIGTLAPTSNLYIQYPPVHAAVDAAVQVGVELQAATTHATNIRAQLVLADEAVGAVRLKFGQLIGVVKSSVEATNPTVADCAALGLAGTIGRPAPAPLVPPASITVHLGKKHGQFRVAAVAPGKPKCGAQVSADPIGAATWQDLPGNGKTRTVTGHPSGALVWVRFRIVRNQAQSDWCTPVAVTVP
jgi:hypothetical protein